MERFVILISSLLGIGLLLFAVTASAQPATPITWGPLEVLYDDPDWPTGGMTACGDTLVLHSFTASSVPGYVVPAVRVSGNDGVTWSPWHVFDEDRFNGPYFSTAFTPWGVLCNIRFNLQASVNGLARSTNLGQRVWLNPCSFHTYWVAGPLVLYHDTLFCAIGPHYLTWTADGGCTFADSLDIGIDQGIENIAVGGGWLHTVCCRIVPDHGKRLYYTRLRLGTGQFEPLRDLLPDIFWSQNAHVECDDDGTVIVLAPIDYQAPLP